MGSFYSYAKSTLQPELPEVEDVQYPLELDAYYRETDVIVLSVLFVIAALGNLGVFINIIRYKIKSRFNCLILHLTISDMITTFLTMPSVIGMLCTVTWRASNAGCKILMFLDQVGIYSSSALRAVICLDRYDTISGSLSAHSITFRGQIMVLFAWIFSVVASIPTGVFHNVLEDYPTHNFKICTSAGLLNLNRMIAYSIYVTTVHYIAPLIVMIIAFLLVCCNMYRRSQTARESEFHRRTPLHRDGSVESISIEKLRTLKMTAVLVLVFLICWTPFFGIEVWYWIHKTPFSHKLYIIFLQLGYSNSCINPIVYGLFSPRVYERCSAICRCFNFRSDQQSLQDSTIQDPDGTPDGTPDADLALPQLQSFCAIRSSTEATVDDREDSRCSSTSKM